MDVKKIPDDATKSDSSDSPFPKGADDDTTKATPSDNPSPNGTYMDLKKILDDAKRAVPAVRFAEAVVGIAAAIAIIAGFKLGWEIAVLGVVIMLGLMTVVVVFSWLVEHGKDLLKPMALALAWTFITLTAGTGICIFSGFFFRWPRPLESYIPSSPSPSPYIQPSLSPSPFDPNQYLQRAQCYQELRQYNCALIEVEQVLAIQPDNAEANNLKREVIGLSKSDVRNAVECDKKKCVK